MTKASGSSTTPGPAAKFRSRKIDFKKALPVFRSWDIADLEENSVINRAVPTVETGVEKEEEEEHHLQAAISAAQANTAPLYIPTPDASQIFELHSKFYVNNFTRSEDYINYESDISDLPYYLDDIDLTWLQEANSKWKEEASQGNKNSVSLILSEDTLEEWMDTLEKLASLDRFLNVLPEEHHFFQQLRIDSEDPMAKEVYSYWLSRRLAEQGSLRASLRYIEDPTKPGADPYVCFRKREVKPIRKTRRSDIQSLEKLKRLKSELDMAKVLLEMVCKREKMRKEAFMLEQLIFEQRCTIRVWKRELNIAEEDSPAPKKIKKKQSEGSTTITIPLKKLKEAVAKSGSANNESDVEGIKIRLEDQPPPEFMTLAAGIQQNLNKKRELDEDWVDVTELDLSSTNQIQTPDLHFIPPAQNFRHYNIPVVKMLPNAEGTSSASHSLRIPFGRRRIGRGGRVVFDRSNVRLFSKKYGGLGYGNQHQGYESPESDDDSTIVIDKDEQRKRMEMHLLKKLQSFKYDLDCESDDELIVYLDQSHSDLNCRYKFLHSEDFKILESKDLTLPPTPMPPEGLLNRKPPPSTFVNTGPNQTKPVDISSTQSHPLPTTSNPTQPSHVQTPSKPSGTPLAASSVKGNTPTMPVTPQLPQNSSLTSSGPALPATSSTPMSTLPTHHRLMSTPQPSLLMSSVRPNLSTSAYSLGPGSGSNLIPKQMGSLGLNSTSLLGGKAGGHNTNLMYSAAAAQLQSLQKQHTSAFAAYQHFLSHQNQSALGKPDGLGGHNFGRVGMPMNLGNTPVLPYLYKNVGPRPPGTLLAPQPLGTTGMGGMMMSGNESPLRQSPVAKLPISPSRSRSDLAPKQSSPSQGQKLKSSPLRSQRDGGKGSPPQGT